MSRNVMLPLLGLIGVVLFSLNQLSRPTDIELVSLGESAAPEIEWQEPEPVRALALPPPPAPKLQSDLEDIVPDIDADTTVTADSTGASALEDDDIEEEDFEDD